MIASMIETDFSIALPLPFVRSDLYTYRGASSGVFPHSHTTFQFTCVLAGAFRVEFPSTDALELSPGDVLLIAPGLRHLWRSEEALTTRTLSLFCEPVSRDVFGPLGDFLSLDVRGDYWLTRGSSVTQPLRLADEILKIDRSENATRSGRLYGLHCLMLAEFGETLLRRFSVPESDTPPELIKVLQMMENRHASIVTLDEMAAAAGLSISRFSVVFKKYFATTPMEYLNRFRVGKACDLLRFTTLSITDIASRTGFNSPHYFCRRFKEITGKSPSKFKAGISSSARSSGSVDNRRRSSPRR